MDQRISEVSIVHGSNHCKSIDEAVYRNFLVRRYKIKPFSSVTVSNEKNLTVSNDILEIMDRAVVNPLLEEYVDMDYDHIDTIASDYDPLKHWSELRGAFSTMDGELLRFILRMKIPLEKFIRHELASRGHDENCQWVGFDKAKEIWRK